jgi:hypothetical protein
MLLPGSGKNYSRSLICGVKKGLDPDPQHCKLNAVKIVKITAIATGSADGTF